jgi:hypothetical protein
MAFTIKVGVFGGLLATGLLHAAPPQFDASIRPSNSGTTMAALLNPGSLSYANYTLADYI